MFCERITLSKQDEIARNKVYNKKKIRVVFIGSMLLIFLLLIRLAYLMVSDPKDYRGQATDLHERKREIKAARGEIVDRNGQTLATNKTVCTISVIHNQIKDSEKVIQMLVNELGISEEEVRKRVEKVSSIERVRANVEKEVGDRIREHHLPGVKVDEDSKRYYPYHDLASKVLGFTGGDNQGIIGLEVKYDDILKGKNGKILTVTDARGIEIEKMAEHRIEPVQGKCLRVSLDYNIQSFCQQAAERVMERKQAESVSVILMNPQNGEILSMVNVPEFDLNHPFELHTMEEVSQEMLNQMWRNRCINDTYEPGSTFKIITSAAGLEEGVVHLEDTFYCPGYRKVEDHKIRCHKMKGHGAETFPEGLRNSCNPVFMEIGMRLGSDRFYDYFEQFGLLSKTKIDLPGEAGTIMHQKGKIGAVELATISFGQSFQITPIQMLTTVSSIINGGRRVTPHLAMEVIGENGQVLETFSYEETDGIVSAETSKIMRELLESVVAEGSGKNASIEGYRIGGKTATSQTLPRSANRYIASFIGFAPAENPRVIGMVIIHDPKGVYYGGTIAAPVLREVYDNILPYLGIEKE